MSYRHQVSDHIQKRASVLRRSPWSLSALIDQAFFLLAGLASFWFGWLVWREGWYSGGWWLVAFFALFWVIMAYLALPRLHRILSSLYVPNYFIGRTRTADGLLGDPVNVALRGSEAQLHQAMIDAGWTIADEITVRSAWKIIFFTLTGRSYASAPVSSLFLFGRRQDFAYQQEVDGSPGKRHHVRFWRCPQGWLLPGGHQVDWLAAGTYDKSVGLSLFTLQVTHKIDENTDIERDYIVKTVTEHTPQVAVTNLKDFSTGYHSRNGGGDSIQTDGDLPVLELAAVVANQQTIAERAGVILDATAHEYVIPTEEHDTVLQQLWNRRPPQISFAILFTALAIAIVLMGALFDFLLFDELLHQTTQDFIVEGLDTSVAATGAEWTIRGVLSLSAGWILVTAVLSRGTFRGSNKDRLLLMILSSLSVLATSFTLTIGKITWTSVGTLAFIGINITIILMLSSDAARQFTHTRTTARRAKQKTT